jgi:hypothetical protein
MLSTLKTIENKKEELSLPILIYLVKTMNKPNKELMNFVEDVLVRKSVSEYRTPGFKTNK